MPTVTPREVSALNHEVLNHSVEGRSLVAKAFLASREGTEVLRRLGGSQRAALLFPRLDMSLPWARSCRKGLSQFFRAVCHRV